LLDWRFKETELKKLRRRRRRLFGKELLMSFSNAQQSSFFIYLFIWIWIWQRCREREEGDRLAAKLEKLILAIAFLVCVYVIPFYYYIFYLKHKGYCCSP